MRFATRLFLDGAQVGTNASFSDVHENVDAAIKDTESWIAEEGWKNATIESANLPQWEGTEPIPTLIVRANTK